MTRSPYETTYAVMSLHRRGRSDAEIEAVLAGAAYEIGRREAARARQAEKDRARMMLVLEMMMK
jgi:hypothetical protein